MRSTIAQSLTPPAYPLSRVQDALIEFPLPAGEEAYGVIDGRKLHRYVVELAEISRHYRDAGHAKFWGRIIGTSGDEQTGEWLAAKFKALGLADVHIQPLDLPPQWFPQSWDVSIRSGGRSITLSSAQPVYGAHPLSSALTMDAVYVGLGTEADFMGKDVRGKAVFVYHTMGQPDEGGAQAVSRADAKGAAVIFNVLMLPGNMRFQAYATGTKAPVFFLGNDDGAAVRDMIAAATAPPKVTASLAIEKVPNLKTSLVWGTLAGTTDETIYITAHKDGWFDGASDNAAGVASMLGLAEYYAKIPQSQRKRTLIFIGLDGHHNLPEGAVGDQWLVKNKVTLFAKTALMINAEHPATILTQARPRYYPGDEAAWSNIVVPLDWYGGGKERPELQRIVWNAFKSFGVPLDLDPRPIPVSDIVYFRRFLPGVDGITAHTYFHTDWETPEVVPWTGLEAVTRAFAKIIDQVNKLPLSALQRPEDTSPRSTYEQ
jgi:hypothetical protein